MYNPIAIFLIAFVAASVILVATVKILTITIIGAVKLWYRLSEITYLFSKGYYHV
jgi:hypothetical protein